MKFHSTPREAAFRSGPAASSSSQWVAARRGSAPAVPSTANGRDGEESSEANVSADFVFETAPLACVNMDANGRIQDLNLAAARLLNTSRQKARGLEIATFFDRRHARRVQQHLALAGDAPRVTSTQLRLKAGGRERVRVEMRTRPSSEACYYRTHLIPLDGPEMESLAPNEPQFRALIENSSEVICVGAPDGTVFYTTPSVRRILGYEPSSWFGRNALEVVHPDDVPAVRKLLRELARAPKGTVLSGVYRVQHQDKSWKWVEAVLTNLIAEAAVGGIVCNYRDVTESRRSEEALRASEQLYRVLTETLPHMIWVRDATGRMEFANQNTRTYRGPKVFAASETNWRAGMHPVEKAKSKVPPWESDDQGARERVGRLRRADGTYRWHSLSMLPLVQADGSRPKWMGIGCDIHARVEAEKERERLLAQMQKERSELALQYAVVGALAESTCIMEAGPKVLTAFCDLLGWELGGMWDFHPATRSFTLLHMHEQPGLAAGPFIEASRNFRVKRGQDLLGRVWVKKAPVWIPNLASRLGSPRLQAAARAGLRAGFGFPVLLGGKLRGVVEFYHRQEMAPQKGLLDIVSALGLQIGQFIERTLALTSLRESEEALLKANSGLEQRVQERTAALHEANRELSAEIRARNRLEREIIHIAEREQRRIGQDLHDGLCQELAALAFMARAAATRLEKVGNAEYERLNQLAELMNVSVTRCRDTARGLHPVEMEADGLMVALNDLANSVDKTVACTFECPERILISESDVAVNLYRIAQEAVTNALKYSQARKIIIRLRRDHGTLSLSVRDDGRGLDKTQANRGKRKRGLGLDIMNYRARTMGAGLKIEAAHPRGTRVVCLLPFQ